MSDEGLEWFAPKRYGYGSGPPISWQGWAITLAYVAIIAGAAFWFRQNVVKAVAIFIPITVVFCVIAARTTKGGWRWRRGEDD